MSKSTTLRGSRAYFAWLLLIPLLLAIGLLGYAFLVIGPKQEQSSRATATAQAEVTETGRFYAAGVALQQAGDWSGAADALRQTISRDAGYKDAAQRLADVLARLDEAATQAVENRYQRALGLMNLGRWAEAETELNAVFDSNPGYKDVQNQLATAISQAALTRPTLTPTHASTPIPTPTSAPTGVPTMLPLPAPLPASTNSGTIIDVTANARQFEILILALSLSNLTDRLKGAGPFTLFAPTDGAFAGLSERTLDSLLADTSHLARVLQFHVVPQKLTAATITDGMTVDTLMGQKLTFAVSGGKITVNGVNVAVPEQPASNGSVFSIGTVLLPSE